MPRMARLVVPHYPHHVTQRGNRRQAVFFCEADYACYRSLLAEACARTASRVWAYCLMPNHVHLVMVPRTEDGLRAALGEAHRRYTRRINSRQQWRGHLWQERFYSFVMDEPHLLAAVRYVERNPVSAGLCREPWEWRWSSARAHVQGRNDVLVEVEPMLGLVPDWCSYVQSVETDAIENQMQRHARTGRPLGDDGFIEALEALTGRRLKRRKPGPRSSHGN